MSEALLSAIYQGLVLQWMKKDFERDFFNKDHAATGLQVVFGQHWDRFPGFSSAMSHPCRTTSRLSLSKEIIEELSLFKTSNH